MPSHQKITSDNLWLLILAAAGVLIHIFPFSDLGFHRDEFLYLMLGKHLAAGFWSNPPLIGVISWLGQLLPGDSLLQARLLPALAGGLLIFLSGLIARELGGKRFAQISAALALMSSLIFLRTFSMLMPVPFDILFWTLILYFFLKFINSENKMYLVLTGVFFGLGMLNKYMVVFLAAGLMIGILVTPFRKLWVNKYLWLAVLIAFVIFLPNLVWQIWYHFPVMQHMQELARTQLVNVNRFNVFAEQILMCLASSVFWIAGLFYLLINRQAAKYRVFGIIYLVVLLLFLLFKGKSYYTAGLYPFFIAAGGVAWERMLRSGSARGALLAAVVILNMLFIPMGIPVMQQKNLLTYFKWITGSGIANSNRWEDAKIHALPQDYADMLGWKELANIVIKGCDSIPDKSRLMIYAENYGQAGAIDFYDKGHHLPPVASFSDSYLLWVPDSIPQRANIFIYVNGELGEDVASAFRRIDSLGCIDNPYAREYGTTVYMCRNPRTDFNRHWMEVVRRVKAERFSTGR